MQCQIKFSAGMKPFDLQQANVFLMSRSDTTLAVQLISKRFVAHVEREIQHTIPYTESSDVLCNAQNHFLSLHVVYRPCVGGMPFLDL